MSLFNQTVRRVSELEAELAAARDQIRNLNIALKAARVDRARAMSNPGRPFVGLSEHAARHELNTLSDADVEEMFRQRDEDLKLRASEKKSWWTFFQRARR